MLVLLCFLTGFILPINAPATESGMGITCIMTRAPVESAGETSPLKNKAIAKIKTVSIVPDNRPVVRGALLQSFIPRNPEKREVRQISITDIGATVARGSLALNAISETKKESISVPVSDMPTEIAESFNISAIESADAVRPEDRRAGEVLLLFI